jgi:aspartyl-tRNA(Asn)/glutamyl-tRNA(Gln) amidotransferase subunit C
MPVDHPTVRKIARLARIAVDDSEIAPLADQLNGILAFVEQLGSVDTAGVEPMASVMPGTLRWRADVVTDGGIADQVLANAPQAASGFFAVPKVIE